MIYKHAVNYYIAILTKALMTYIVTLEDHKTHSLVESTLGILIKNTSQST